MVEGVRPVRSDGPDCARLRWSRSRGNDRDRRYDRRHPRRLSGHAGVPAPPGAAGLTTSRPRSPAEPPPRNEKPALPAERRAGRRLERARGDPEPVELGLLLRFVGARGGHEPGHHQNGEADEGGCDHVLAPSAEPTGPCPIHWLEVYGRSRWRSVARRWPAGSAAVPPGLPFGTNAPFGPLATRSPKKGYDWNTTSPCWDTSRPASSSSAPTRRPTATSTSFRMTSVAIAL